MEDYEPDINALVNATVRLEDKHSRVLNEIAAMWCQENIGRKNIFAFKKLLLGAVEIKVHKKTIDEIDNRITEGR